MPPKKNLISPLKSSSRIQREIKGKIEYLEILISDRKREDGELELEIVESIIHIDRPYEDAMKPTYEETENLLTKDKYFPKWGRYTKKLRMKNFLMLSP